MADAIDVAEQVAAVGVLRDEAQRLALAAAADEDRDVAADRPRVVQGVGDVMVGALDRRASCVNIAREIRRASSRCSKRSLSGGKRKP